LILSSYEGNGIETIREALLKGAAVDSVTITYLGGGKYKLVVKGSDYKEAEPKLKEASELVVNHVLAHKGLAEFKRK
ncbi:MAG: translation initiation factor IF-2 subunit alpha, partial [Nanoarchaeota archaeon]|nr:translation initiation factor IF-2 subunit alpha [Nanoarchaeota archaeon]